MKKADKEGVLLFDVFITLESNSQQNSKIKYRFNFIVNNFSCPVLNYST